MGAKRSPVAFTFLMYLLNQIRPMTSINRQDIQPLTNPAVYGVPKLLEGTALWICTAPGEIMAKVEQPKHRAPGMILLGMSAARNTCSAIENTQKAHTWAVTPPYANTPHASGTDIKAKSTPMSLMIAFAIDLAAPVISIAFASSVPVKNNRK